jgi:tetratricopeptide (TPR) repeat protein
LRAFAYSEIARKRARKADYDGALSAMDKAMSQQLAPRDTKLKTSLIQNHVAALRLAAMTSAKVGAYAKSMQIIERLLNLRGISAGQRREYETYRKQAMLLSAAKSMADESFLEAALIYRTGRRLYPQDDTIKHNLIAALERLSLGKVDGGLCEEIEILLQEIHTLDPRETFTRPAKIRCLLIRANQRLQNDDYPEAVAWLKAATRSFPGNNLIRENLIVTYMKWLDFEVNRGACRKLAGIKAEVLVLEGSSRAQIEEITSNCLSR